MKLTIQQIQQHFDGFLQTQHLWKNNNVFNLQQFDIQQKSIAIDLEIGKKLRLGKYIERFVSFQISRNENCEIVSENIQIQQDKITLGELDCLLYKDKKPIHLEVIYKFYVFDTSVGQSEIETAPNVGNDDNARFIQGVCHKNNELLILVELNKLLTDQEWSDIEEF